MRLATKGKGLEYKESIDDFLEKDNLYQLILEKSTDVVFIQDTNQNIVYVSPSIEPLTGYSVEEALNMNAKDFMTSASYEKGMESLQEYLALAMRGEDVDVPPMEYEYVCKDGSTTWGELKSSFLKDSTGNVIGVQGVIRDVGERKKAEKRLKESEKEMAMVLGSTSELIVHQDRLHRVVWANNAAANSVEETPENLKGRYCYDVWHHRNKPCENCPVDKALVTGETHEGEITSPDGRVWLIQGNPVKDDGGRITGVVEVSLNITERRKMEDRVNQLNEVLKLLNKTLRHDILNDLTVVRNSMEMYEELEDKKMLHNAYNSIDDSISLIKKMKRLESLIPSGDSLEPYSAREIIEELVKNQQISAEVNGDCTVIADEAFTSVIDNIISNAINHGQANHISIKIENDGENCWIMVADNGKGIPEEKKEEVFNEGFSGNGGSGLGLYIVKKTIERYGGKIRMENNEPNGVVVLLKLKCQK
ncbi:MAG: PAS domain-containing sensor histidine kinase [Archaeoglobaceae archaeon]